jgi:DNA-binding NarL/FixJ family response regulator
MIYVSIIEDDPEMREQLMQVIKRSRGYACVSAFPDCESAIKKLAADKPDVVLMDIGLPGMSGVDGAAAVKEKWPEIEVVMLTIHDEEDLVLASLRNGATGYLLKGSPPDRMLDALQEVVDGGAPMSMSVARRVAESFRLKIPPEPLSRREHEVLSRLRDGQSYQEIADGLFVAKSTIKFHIKNIYRKLHVATRYELMKR